MNNSIDTLTSTMQDQDITLVFKTDFQITDETTDEELENAAQSLYESALQQLTEYRDSLIVVIPANRFSSFAPRKTKPKSNTLIDQSGSVQGSDPFTSPQTDSTNIIDKLANGDHDPFKKDDSSKNVFSSFDQINVINNINTIGNFNDTSSVFKVDHRSPEEKVEQLSLKELIKRLEALSLVKQGFLPNTYQFNRYTYSIDSNSWSSPFSTSGTGSVSLLEDLVSYVELGNDKYDDFSRDELINLVASVS